MSQPVLKLDRATIRFGGLVAVDNVSFELQQGVLFGLIGPNGAGKTTVFNIVTGVYSPTSGDILFHGERINGLAPHKIARKGICRTFQNIRLFKTLSVLDNVVVDIRLADDLHASVKVWVVRELIEGEESEGGEALAGKEAGSDGDGTGSSDTDDNA